MSEFLLLLPIVMVPGCGLTLLLWLDRLEGTVDQAVQRRSARAAAARACPEHCVLPSPASPTGQRPR